MKVQESPFIFEIGDPVRLKKENSSGRRGIVYEREEGNTYNFYDPLTDTYHDGGWFEWALELDT